MADTPTPSDPVAAIREALPVVAWHAEHGGEEHVHLRENHLLRNFDPCTVTPAALTFREEAEARIAALLAQLEAAQKDQARYRWLRSTWCFSILERLFGITTGRTPNAQLDDAIDQSIAADAALAEQQEANHGNV